MDILGILFVGSIIGLTTYYLYPQSKKLRLRSCMLMGAMGAFAISFIGKIFLSYQDGSMRSICIILLGAIIFSTVYAWSRD